MKKENVDKGFELGYYILSYRRRFIRSLWLIPWCILALWLLHWVGASNFVVILVAIIFSVTAYLQARYNYKKWKEEEENGKEI